MANTSQRIAIFVATSGHSGVDRAMQHLIPALAERGYPVDVLKVRRHGPHLTQIPDNVQIIDLQSAHTYTSLPALVRYLRRYQPAALLADKDRVNRTALLARWLAGVKTRLVLSSGTTISVDLQHRSGFERWLQRNSMGKLYPYADQVIVTCDDVGDDMANYTGLPRSLIKTVPSPVLPDDLFERQYPAPDHPWFQPKQVPVIVGVGELSRRKDFATLIRAFAQLQQQRDCRLLILGKGNQQAALQALIDELKLTDKVSLAGYVDNPYQYLAHADLFAFSSRWEGLGFVIIEALAMGTPVVATQCPSGPREILQDGNIGALVPVGDSAAMALALQRSLAQPRPAAHSLQQAVAHYRIAASTSAYLQVLGLSERCC